MSVKGARVLKVLVFLLLFLSSIMWLSSSGKAPTLGMKSRMPRCIRISACSRITRSPTLELTWTRGILSGVASAGGVMSLKCRRGLSLARFRPPPLPR